MLCGYPGDHGVQVTFELFGVVESGQAVGQLEEKSAEERDDSRCLLSNQLPIGRAVRRLQLGNGFFADRDELVHQALEYRGQFRIAGSDHQQLEPGTCTRPLRFDGGTHGLLSQLR